ncbi:MAG: hypothetical protein CMD07_03580 [Flavobacteriales bacterium]|nr:hypothetical protein [Flavobacteriales bacterium]|tara:strand:- start:10762 stop:11367 length:606 start_codon:yes stop_codon:yes gene_type:complete
MKKIIYILILISSEAFSQNLITKANRNDHYTSIGLLTSFKKIPFGINLNTLKKNKKFGIFLELKFNRLNFDDKYEFIGNISISDSLLSSSYIDKKNILKMINIGTIINPQEIGILNFKKIDLDFFAGIGIVQNFVYKFYANVSSENQSIYSNKFYIIDLNDHGLNFKFGSNISFENFPLLFSFGYDTKPKSVAISINIKVK